MAEKLRKVYYSIGEVERITGIKQHILRFWENEFPVLNPKRSRSGIRAYKERDIQIILYIKDLLYQQKFTIEGAKRKLREDRGIVHEESVPFEKLEIMALLKEIRGEFRELSKMIDEL